MSMEEHTAGICQMAVHGEVVSGMCDALAECLPALLVTFTLFPGFPPSSHPCCVQSPQGSVFITQIFALFFLSDFIHTSIHPLVV